MNAVIRTRLCTENPVRRHDSLDGEELRRINGSNAGAGPVLEAVERRHAGEVATRYRYTDGGGEIGIITSVSSPFCGDCSRLRLAADGKLYPCLFASNSVDLKAALRSGATDDELLEAITGLWSKRSDRYSELRSSEKTAGQPARAEMYQIGG